MCNVRGIGVAVMVITSTVARKALSRSLTPTPKRCSSSMTTSPRLLNWTSACARRWVPMTRSTEPSADSRQNLTLLPARAEAAEDFDPERVFAHAAAKRAAVLGRQHGRRHQHGHLVAGIDGLERSAHGQLGLAVAHVAADQPIHRPHGLHVLFDSGDARALVGRFRVGERGVKFLLPFGIGRKTDAGPAGSRGLQFEHVAGQVDDRHFGRLFLPNPGLAADLGQRGPGLAAADVLLHEFDLRCRHVNLCPAVELQFEVLFGVAVLFQQLQAAITADAVGHVDHQVAFAQLEKTVDHAAQAPPRRPADLGPME